MLIGVRWQQQLYEEQEQEEQARVGKNMRPVMATMFVWFQIVVIGYFPLNGTRRTDIRTEGQKKEKHNNQKDRATTRG